MDIDAALKDGYSIEEINAEAAKRAGFNLTGAKADGYSDDEILQELRGRLSKTSTQEQKPKYLQMWEQVAPHLKTLGQDVLGTGAAVGDILAGGIKMPLGISSAIGGKIHSAVTGQDYNLEELLI